jgi:hypothetical protein
MLYFDIVLAVRHGQASGALQRISQYWAQFGDQAFDVHVDHDGNVLFFSGRSFIDYDDTTGVEWGRRRKRYDSVIHPRFAQYPTGEKDYL